MSSKVTLYDLRQRTYPNKRGDIFRSVQVFECWVCGALSNEVVMGGWPGYGVRVICPQSSECWHHEMEDKIKALDEALDKTMKDLRTLFLKEIKEDYIFERNAADVYMPKDGTGDIRTKIPYRCSGCGALTNKVVIKEKYGKEVMAPICPQADKVWHRRMMKKFKALTGKIDKTTENLRHAHHKKIKNDLVGNPDLSLKKIMTNVRAWKRDRVCPHYK